MKFRLIIGLLVSLAATPIVWVVQRPVVVVAGDVKACREGCVKDYQACMSQTPAADPEHERARRNTCADRRIACDKNCK